MKHGFDLVTCQILTECGYFRVGSASKIRLNYLIGNCSLPPVGIPTWTSQAGWELRLVIKSPNHTRMSEGRSVGFANSSFTVLQKTVPPKQQVTEAISVILAISASSIVMD